jgi:hypothetical protein
VKWIVLIKSYNLRQSNGITWKISQLICGVIHLSSKKDETNLLETKEIIKQYLFEFEWFILSHKFFESYEGLMDFSNMLDPHTKELIFLNSK